MNKLLFLAGWKTEIETIVKIAVSVHFLVGVLILGALLFGVDIWAFGSQRCIKFWPEATKQSPDGRSCF